MGAWGSAAWDNDLAADWFANLFEKTELARHVEKPLSYCDPEEYAAEIRAAAWVLAALGRVYVWPVPDLERHLKLAVAKMEAIRELPDYEDLPEIDEEITVLRSRLRELNPRDAEGGGPKPGGRPSRCGPSYGPAEALRNLSDPDPAVRLRAARWITRTAALGETSNEVEGWIANAAAMSPIIAALDDPDPRVAEEAVITVAEASRKYFKDDRAYPGVVRLLKSKRALTRMWAVEAAHWLRGKRCLDDVLPLVEDKAAKVKKKALGVAAVTGEGRKLKPGRRERLLEAARSSLRDKDYGLRSAAASLLGAIGDRSHLDDLRKGLKKERASYMREDFEQAIEKIEERG
jgi:hypothetical protein